MTDNQFFICEEDNVFDTLSSLYEELSLSPYADAPGLDPYLEWEEESLYNDILIQDESDIIEAYGVDPVDFRRGDILLASVYQEGPNKNLAHLTRPFLAIYATANMVFGFQLTSGNPSSLANYLVSIPEYEAAGLKLPSNFMLNMVRGVAIQKLKRRIGHITEVQKQAILKKLYEIKENKEGLYSNCALNDRIDITIDNVSRIRC